MQITQNEILFIYNSKNLQERQALGLAKSLPGHEIKEFDLQKDTFTETQVEELANILDVDPVSLIDDKSDTYQKTYSKVSLTREGALTAIAKKPELMKSPIAVYNDQAKSIEAPYEIAKWNMSNTSAIQDSGKYAKNPVHHDKKNQVFYADLGNERMTLKYTKFGPNGIDFTSTFVPKVHRGKGYGRRLVNHGINYAKQQGLEIKASCPFVADILGNTNS